MVKLPLHRRRRAQTRKQTARRASGALAGFLGLWFSAVVSAQEAARDVFLNLRAAEREYLQATLRDGGLYDAGLDGLWGPTTARALRLATERLGSVGIHYDLYNAGSASELVGFLLSEAGYIFLVPEGRECDGCDLLGEPEVSQTALTLQPGVFQRIAPPEQVGVRVKRVHDAGTCVADLGVFTDGVDHLEVQAWRNGGWGFHILSDRNLMPPLVALGAFSGDILPMSGTSDLTDRGWKSTFANGHDGFMDELLEGETTLNLSTDLAESQIQIIVPEFPELLVALRACVKAEEHRNAVAYCAQFPPEDRDFHRSSVGWFCEDHW